MKSYLIIIAIILMSFMNNAFSTYNLTVINKTKSDIDIEYVICTKLIETKKESVNCDTNKIKFTVPEKYFVINPFATSMKPIPQPNQPYSFTFPSLISITSSANNFHKAEFLSLTEYMKVCDQHKNADCLSKYGLVAKYDLQLLNSLDSDARALVVDDEDVGFFHIKLITKHGLPLE